ncbi:ABC transporter ATP-binding protein [Pseudomonas typographi]|uniref:ABC transporter ATP-binding protein n=1 Tax=Pseudomonas typographi TaxID=2715964 RepID=UPI001682D7CE|nr:sn-glycerol-3-phosphate ABC transporter ATP-binding protein UgpC [Pseudomonas typographi]MBD1552223.1 sn-glycerol-3-phosphate ABC transporter ATP-binding protein UgpC [Pseudomonas typographi]
MATVTIQKLRKNYGAIPVLHGIDLAIADGQFVSLVGASGCGKSTLLRMIAGLESVTAGTIDLNGRVINDVSPKDRDIAMVFQNYALYPHMTVAQNMGFSLHLRKESPARIDQAVKETAALLGLSNYLDRYPKALSGGQRQRVAMGRAIVRHPQVFLFDEPLSNLDAKLRVQMRIEIRTLQRRLGTTAIYVTHDQMEAMTMSDLIVVMNGGRIEQVGAPIDVYDRPANLFVATFIGSPAMNLIEGVLEHEQGLSQVRVGGQRIALGRRIDLAAAAPVVMGIRPEHLALAPAQGLEFTLPFKVDLIEPTGAESHVYGQTGSTSIVAALSRKDDLQLGQAVHLRGQCEHIHLFDKATGARLD